MKNVNLPFIPLRNLTVLPGMTMQIDISRKKSIMATNKSMGQNQTIFLVTQIDHEVVDPDIDDLYKVGCIAKIKQVVKLPNKILRIQVEGQLKAELCDIEDRGDYCLANVAPFVSHFSKPDEVTNKAMVMALHELIKRYAIADLKMSRDLLSDWLAIKDANKLMEAILKDYPMDYTQRQVFLEVTDINEMYELLAKTMLEDCEAFAIREELAIKVKNRVDKNQREYILREQIGVLNEELDGKLVSEIDDFKQKIEALDAADYVKEKLFKELRRLKEVQGSSSEANVQRTYIENCLELPWNVQTVDNKDIFNARDILDEDHYGMKEIKERVLESLAVRNITTRSDAPIICLVGPPGTGKTSIARSVARALNKNYVRICLGGVRDEAEIRGHRKTYIGAMPGRIIDALVSAGSNNPLMLLDEIDKMSSDYKGDTQSALLEVLDSEQNTHFLDHYIEMPVDLSNVLFIATANDLSGISRPLLDRMEIIEVNSYTENEKLHIAKEHLIKKQIKKNGLMQKDVKFTDKAINKIITSYTREAGVRNLERQISKVCRKAVKNLYELGAFLEDGTRNKDVKEVIRVTDKNLEEFLGKEKYRREVKNKNSDIGIVRGLAWTAVGGDTLEIEVNTMPGRGELKLTGSMGDVMKESAMIALSYVRSITEKGKYKVDIDFFEKHNIHIHIPEGATPKDGPSAGVTLATGILSAVTGIKVFANLAMTGEITLRGKVLAIGGLKEKLLAAKAAKITKVLVPIDNEKDIEEFDEEILEGMEIVYVKNMLEVLDNSLDI
ncbi:MAG: endopeptidase La [Lachnospira sp.]|nr:endopeptidase La [Lachnospira sp.]